MTSAEMDKPLPEDPIFLLYHIANLLHMSDWCHLLVSIIIFSVYTTLTSSSVKSEVYNRYGQTICYHFLHLSWATSLAQHFAKFNGMLANFKSTENANI